MSARKAPCASWQALHGLLDRLASGAGSAEPARKQSRCVIKASADAAALCVEQNSEFTAQISVQFSRQMRWMKIIQYLLFALYRGFYKIWFI